MILNIITEPNKILRQVGAEVELSKIKTSAFQKLLSDMVETMYAKDGVGLAAPQINISEQICVITKNYIAPISSPFKGRGGVGSIEDLVLINPTWEKLSRWQAMDEEGCLSVPGIYGKVKRYKKIKVKALDKNGAPIEFTAEGFFARIIQHEIDHLNGILIIDKAKSLRKIN